MNITILLNNGMKFKATGVQYDAAEFAKAVNNQALLMVNIGHIVVNKHAVLMIMPSELGPTE